MLDKLVVKFLVLKMWLSDDHGQDMIEYALIGGLIAAAIMGAVALLSGKVTSMFTGIGNCIDFDNTH